MTPSSRTAPGAANDDAVHITAAYLDEAYEKIVKPQRRFLIPNYFIHHWVRRLGPTLAWLVISLQQACWRADADHCTISQAELGEELGFTERAVRKVLKKNPWLSWFVPQIAYQKGTVDRRGIYRPWPRQYTVYVSPPLIPEHLAGLYHYFQQACPGGQAELIEQSVDALLAMKSKAALDFLAALAGEAPALFDAPCAVKEVLQRATGFDDETLPPPERETHRRKLAALQRHLTDIGDTVCRQYFRRQWLPRLGPSLAWLVMGLRSRCYYNPQTGELRDISTWKKKDLVALIGQSRNNLPHLLAHEFAGHFLQIIDHQKHKLTLRVALAQEPLTTESARAFWKNQPGIVHNRPKNAQKVPVTSPETHKKFRSPPKNAQKVPLYKYYKQQVLFNVVVGEKDQLEKILVSAGLSGSGLRKLCHKDPPLDPQKVRAVILYAEAHGLGTGYIYRHLDDDAPVDDLFLQLAALDDETRAFFQQGVGELQTTGLLSPELRAKIPVAQRDLFARYAAAWAGFDPAAVVALLEHAQAPRHANSYSEGGSPKNDELTNLWQRALAHLQLQMTRQTFDAWLRGTSLLERRGEQFIVAVRSEAARVWLERRLYAVVQRSLASALSSEGDEAGAAIVVRFVVAG